MEPHPIRSETIFQGRIFRLRRDRLELKDGLTTEQDIIEHPQTVTLVPFAGPTSIWFIRQYRHAAGGTLLELPAGTAVPGEDLRAAAVRECREEIGMAPGELQFLGAAYLAPGYSTELNHIFLCRDLARDPLQPDHDELISPTELTFEAVAGAIASGELQDAKSLAALFLALRHIGRLSDLS